MDAFLETKPNVQKHIFNIIFNNLIENNEINKEFLMLDGNHITILLYAVYHDLIDDEFLKKFIDNGGDINKTKKYSIDSKSFEISPLEIIIIRRQFNIAVKFISFGARVSERELNSYIKVLMVKDNIKDPIKKKLYEKLVKYSPKSGNYLITIINKRDFFTFDNLFFMINQLIKYNLIDEIPILDPHQLSSQLEEYLRINNLYIPRPKKKKLLKIFKK